MSVNLVVLVGHLGSDPEVRYTQAGDPVATLSVATSERWKDKQGQKQEDTEWSRCVAFKHSAAFCEKYLTKGDKVSVQGKLKTRKWQDNEGNDKWTTEVVVNRIEKESKSGGGESGGPEQQSFQGSADGSLPF